MSSAGPTTLAKKMATAILAAASPGPDQERASEWLDSFQRTNDAWQASLEVIKHPKTELVLFATNVLLTKVRQSWESLGLEQQTAVLATAQHRLDTLVRSEEASRAAVDRLYLLYANCTSLMGVIKVTELLGRAVELCRPTAAADTSLARRNHGIRMLSALGQETLQRPHRASDAVRAAVGKRIGAIVTLISESIAVGAAPPPVPPPAVAAPQPVCVGPLAGTALEAAEPLIKAGMTLPLLARHRPILLVQAAATLVGGALVPPGGGSSAGAAHCQVRYPLDGPAANAAEKAMDFLIAILGDAGARLDQHKARSGRQDGLRGHRRHRLSGVSHGSAGSGESTRTRVSRGSGGAVDGGEGASGAAESTESRKRAAIQAMSQAQLTSAAVGRLAGLLGCTYEHFRQATAAQDHPTCRRLANVALACFDASPDTLASADSEHARAAAGVLRLLADACASPNIQVAGLAADAWSTLREEVPVGSRPPVLRAPLLRHVIESLLRASSYPDGFSSWEAHPIPEDGGPADEDEFERFREGSVQPALEACAEDLGAGPYTGYLRGLLSHAADGSAGWQSVEVVLFAIRGCHLQLKAAWNVSGSRGTPPGGPSLGGPGGAGPSTKGTDGVGRFLESVFTAISKQSPAFVSHPAVVAAGSYACWKYSKAIAGMPDIIQGLFQFLCKASPVPQAAKYAAIALRSLVGRRVSAFATPKHLGAIRDTFANARRAGCSTECLSVLIKTAGVVCDSAPGDRAIALLREMAKPLSAELMRVGGAGAAAGGGGGVSLLGPGPPPSAADGTDALIQPLELLAALLQGARADVAAGQAPAAVQLLQSSWPAIDAVAKSVVRSGSTADSAVVRGLVDVLRSPFEAVRLQAMPAVPQVLPAVVSLLRATATPAALEAAVGIITDLGETPDQRAQSLFVAQGGDALKLAAGALSAALDASPPAGPRSAVGTDSGSGSASKVQGLDDHSPVVGRGGPQDLGVTLFDCATRLIALAPRVLMQDPGRQAAMTRVALRALQSQFGRVQHSALGFLVQLWAPGSAVPTDAALAQAAVVLGKPGAAGPPGSAGDVPSPALVCRGVRHLLRETTAAAASRGAVETACSLANSCLEHLPAGLWARCGTALLELAALAGPPVARGIEMAVRGGGEGAGRAIAVHLSPRAQDRACAVLKAWLAAFAVARRDRGAGGEGTGEARRGFTRALRGIVVAARGHEPEASVLGLPMPSGSRAAGT